MRRLGREDSERGAIGVVVALLMVALLGFAALTVDVGVMYAEKAQLQNGADAAALSIAQSCSQDDTGLCAATPSLAASYANSNALDGLANVQNVDLDIAARSVTVTTGAQEEGGEANSVSLYFANALGISSAEVGAAASAEWGSPTEGTAPFPLAFSICQVLDKDTLQLFQSHGNNANPDCGYGPSGHVVPGGFGWLGQESGLCSANINIAVDATATSDTGNDGPENCDTLLNSWANKLAAGEKVTVLLPVFDDVITAVNPAQFDLMGFAAIDIHGWKFSGGNNTPPMSFRNTNAYLGSLECKGSCRGIVGSFLEYVSLEDGYELGPINEDLGATVVRLKELEPSP